ncbi:hypothetical protein Taro_013120, partial [Colocasia esculenta]|nr:hypothetical protein [Colocasia esculenta]
SYLVRLLTRVVAENKSTIGVSWAPKVPPLTCGRRTTSEMAENLPQVSAWKIEGELVDGLFVPPRDPRKLNKFLKKNMKDTTGKSLFDMPTPTISPDIKKDLEILKVCHYYVDYTIDFDFDSCHMGTVVESTSDFFSGRLTKKERKQSIADELHHEGASNLTQAEARGWE